MTDPTPTTGNIMPKSALSFMLAVVTILLIAYSVYLAIKGNQDMATYCLVWAIAVHCVIRSYLG